jgi:hypothetical protein
MYVNAKMISVEIIPGIGDRREIIESGSGGSEFKYDVFGTL